MKSPLTSAAKLRHKMFVCAVDQEKALQMGWSAVRINGRSPGTVCSLSRMFMSLGLSKPSSDKEKQSSLRKWFPFSETSGVHTGWVTAPLAGVQPGGLRWLVPASWGVWCWSTGRLRQSRMGWWKRWVSGPELQPRCFSCREAGNRLR